MARKDLLKGLMSGEDSTSPRNSAPRMTGGAIGAVSRSIADLRTRALVDVPADLIDGAGLRDRLEPEADLEALVDSMREHGQQVPVMLRHSPNAEGRYEVVYGRRRIAALRRLDMPVRAFVRDINDRDLVVAQGQENSARRDLSFIEKALFAKSMIEMGFDRKITAEALHADKTVISRMLTVVDALPEPLIQAIGAAPSAGRDRWLTLATRAKDRDLDTLIAAAQGPDSDARFVAVFNDLAPQRKPKAPDDFRGLLAQGEPIGSIRTDKGRCVIDVPQEFGEWLAQNINQIHRDWENQRGE
ncbi:plasmid partitioning protein RepB [Pararhodobacter oceanensis]|uniref:Plasmid partitioning protein RepB n=1 Tax=Pararhodobacter oceanensis TaxID=2172121 RepID=A0A2T8HQ56_9RHOB|nr:plasmid partitioning protein RepB [Pararhodobacter oceanensis]PVH27412.1 plasmid partitioning protein RepB [Pararhodobacter oceanensis]